MSIQKPLSAAEGNEFIVSLAETEFIRRKRMCNCVNIDMGSYENQVGLKAPWKNDRDMSRNLVYIDRCLVQEIVDLWAHGIITMASCCGHNVTNATIAVADEHISKMESLGYKKIKNPCSGGCKWLLESKTVPVLEAQLKERNPSTAARYQQIDKLKSQHESELLQLKAQVWSYRIKDQFQSEIKSENRKSLTDREIKYLKFKFEKSPIPVGESPEKSTSDFIDESLKEFKSLEDALSVNEKTQKKEEGRPGVMRSEIPDRLKNLPGHFESEFGQDGFPNY